MAKIITDEQKVEQLLTRGVTEVINKEHLKKELMSGRQLRVKLGIDPTAPDLHLGHAVVLRKLREFQDLGHKAVLVIGDFTAQAGDPTGKSKTRVPLTEKQVKLNMAGYLKQAGKVINLRKAEVRYNSKWLTKIKFTELFRLMGLMNATQLLQRDDFRKRMEKEESVRINELMYPIMQALDSVNLKADVELGGNDQLLNNLTGRTLMEKMDMQPQDVLTVQLLEGTDGKEKMSKSLGNYIGLSEPANEMFGKIMSVKDEAVNKYFLLCTNLSDSEIQSVAGNPKEKKLRLAFEIVKMYHSEKAALAAQQEFDAVFGKKGVPTNIPEVVVAEHALRLSDLVSLTQLATSKSEARRLIEQGGVKVNELKKTDPAEVIAIDDGMVVQVGPRRFVKIKRG